MKRNIFFIILTLFAFIACSAPKKSGAEKPEARAKATARAKADKSRCKIKISHV